MKKNLVQAAPCLLVLTADFYLLPLLARDTGGAMFLMLLVMPLTAFAAALLFGLRRGFCPWLPAAAALLFAPTLWLFYNRTAWPYPLFYAGLTLAANALGGVFSRRR